jgi:serine/threonine protein kinase
MRELSGLCHCAPQAHFVAARNEVISVNQLPQEYAQTPAPARPIIGERYRLTQKIGKGGFGVVYLAHDIKLHDRPVVIKVLAKNAAAQHQDWRLLKFRQEAEALARINHPGVVSVLDRGDLSDGRPYLVMEYVSGVTLQEEMARAPLSLPRIARIVHQLGAALQAAHDCGISHRDLKPSNVMLQGAHTDTEQARLIDFGIAHVNDSLWAMQSASLVAGTRQYMAPEQLAGQVKDYTLSDLYSLGVIVYEMIAGRIPFDAQSEVALFEQQREGGFTPPSHWRPDFPITAEQVLRRALAFEPAARHARISAFSQEFVQVLASNTTVPRSSLPTVTLSDEEPLERFTTQSLSSPEADSAASAEPVGGAVPLDSAFYIVRPTDEEFRQALLRRDSIVLLKGARQMGKTSLLARGLQVVRNQGARVVLTDLQTLNAAQLQSIDACLRSLADDIAEQLELPDDPLAEWDERRGASRNFSRYLERRVLPYVTTQLVWGLDEVDRLFSCPFGSEVFGLFRSWHNARSLNPQTPLHKLTLAIAYATEAHLFITDINQSPFNVGTRLALNDFTLAQVAELNQRYHAPLVSDNAVAEFYRLVGGQPYLVRSGLKTIAERHWNFATFVEKADREDGPFGDHLRRLLLMLKQDAALCESVRALLQGQPRIQLENFYRLRSAGVLVGESVTEVHPRCQLYADYLRQHLL